MRNFFYLLLVTVVEAHTPLCTLV